MCKDPSGMEEQVKVVEGLEGLEARREGLNLMRQDIGNHCRR